MTVAEYFVENRAITLGSMIGKGGEGEIYTLAENGSLALKLYTVADTKSREQKIAAMLQAELGKKAPLVAFPLAAVKRRSGAFAGFVMRRVIGFHPLHDLYAPGPRKSNFPQTDYRFLVRAATNIARAVGTVHAANSVIGDINHSSMLVSNKAVVALIDADSFQISANGQTHFCRVGVPEYTPPELQGKSFNGVVRTSNHDAFGLAIVIFQMLFMGRHPFV